MGTMSATPLEALLAELLDVPVMQMGDNAGHDTVPEWTSLAHIQIVTAIEEAYDVTLSTQEILHATTIGRLRAVLRMKGVPL